MDAVKVGLLVFIGLMLVATALEVQRVRVQLEVLKAVQR